jgi:hypothetical protein
MTSKGNVDATRGDIETLIRFVQITVAKESATMRVKLELMGIIGTKVRPTNACKYLKARVIRSGN